MDIRIIGTADDTARVLELLREHLDVTRVSDPYPGRGTPGVQRTYVQAALPPRAGRRTGQRTCWRPGEPEHDHEMCRDVVAELCGAEHFARPHAYAPPYVPDLDSEGYPLEELCGEPADHPIHRQAATGGAA